MKYLDIPTTLNDMTYSLSLTGVTILTKSRFKARHTGSKEIIQTIQHGFLLKSQLPKEPKAPTKRRKQPKKLQEVRKITTERPQKLLQYNVNKKEVSHRIRGYINQMKGEKMLYFWTITFPPTTEDNTCYILLNKWLTRLRHEKMIKEYLWITERQQNGTIHFHMVINRKMNVVKANKYMRASIMHSINKGEITYDRTQATKYNGVDIAKDRKTRRVINFAKQSKQKSLTNYLTKYVTKNNEKFTHLAWHSSREYSNLITAVRFTSFEYNQGKAENLLDNKEPIITEWYTFRRWKGSPPPDLLAYLGQLNQGLQEKFN